ncbi:MAG: hypothetical protein ABJD07_06460 [Gemmatimonadaceae bacterium]
MGNPKVMILPALMVLIMVVIGVVLARRLRGYSLDRAHAEQRAAAAFEEMSRLTGQLRKQLDQREPEEATADLPPGEALIARYPGVRSKGEDGGARTED